MDGWIDVTHVLLLSCRCRPSTATTSRTTKGYPLRIRAVEVVVEPQEADPELVRRLLPKLDIETLRSALNDLKDSVPDLPELPDNICVETNMDVLHHLLMNIHVRQGTLICPESQREFPIKDGIPNMILHEDEI
jgi:multifunctional methyltransferase subunit TRM112